VASGFTWVPGLARLLEEYEKDRAAYPTLADFGPRIAAYFAALAPPGGNDAKR
jgi:hypothetical protein